MGVGPGRAFAKDGTDDFNPSDVADEPSAVGVVTLKRPTIASFSVIADDVEDSAGPWGLYRAQSDTAGTGNW